MAQRNSGFPRKAHDFYETPAWMMETLLEVARTIAGLAFAAGARP
jgi:hypothetical protein